MSDWQPICTAPRDGSWVIAWPEVLAIPVVARWLNARPGMPETDAAWDVPFTDTWVKDNTFTHWMPLPPPPSEG